MPGQTSETLFFNTIFSAALEKRATDIHFMSGNYPVLRIGTMLSPMADKQILTPDLIGSLVESISSEEERNALTHEKEIRTVYTWANRARFRATIFYQQGYPAVSFRLIPTEIATPATLGLPDELMQRIQRKTGLIIICGPFNSGRTTTVISLLNHINTTASRRIVTLERPIEYIMANSQSLINQREVGKDVATFSDGVRALIDSDAEVVFVSELNEPSIYELLLTLTESGKLVFGIINALSSISALEKIIDSVPKDRRSWMKDTLSSVLLALVNQRLLSGVGGGRVLATEILTMTPAVSSLIQDETLTRLPIIMQTSRDDGMVSLDARLQDLVKAGKVSLEEARQFAIDPANFHA